MDFLLAAFFIIEIFCHFKHPNIKFLLIRGIKYTKHMKCIKNML